MDKEDVVYTYNERNSAFKNKKRREGVKSKNMYKGPIDKDNGAGRTERGRGRVGRAGESNGGEWGQLY